MRTSIIKNISNQNEEATASDIFASSSNLFTTPLIICVISCPKISIVTSINIKIFKS